MQTLVQSKEQSLLNGCLKFKSILSIKKIKKRERERLLAFDQWNYMFYGRFSRLAV